MTDGNEVELTPTQLANARKEFIAKPGTVFRHVPCCDYAYPQGEYGPIFWNPYNNVVQCHNCGAAFVESLTSSPSAATHDRSSEIVLAAQSVVQWFDDYKPDEKGPRIERLRAALPEHDWRDAIKIIPVVTP